MKKYIVALLVVTLLSSSFVAVTSFVKAEGEEPGYDWMQKVDKDLLKKMSNVEILGDIDADGYVDSSDFYIFSGAYGSSVGDSAYNSAADLDADGDVDSSDFYTFSGNYGKTRDTVLLTTIVTAVDNLEGVEDLIASTGGKVDVTLDSINSVSAKIPANKIETIAESGLVTKVWLDHEIKLQPSYDQMNSKAEILERMIESSTKHAPSEEFKSEEFKLDTQRFDPERYAVPDGGIIAIEEKDIAFQSIEFGDVNPETYFTYQVGAEELWAQGYFGQDTYIAVLDVGINALHPMVSSAIVGGNSQVPFEPNWDSNLAIHGTMTASMAVGRPVVALVPEDSYLGLAFARWFPEKVLWPAEYPWIPIGYIGIAFIGEAPMANLWVEKVLAFEGYGEMSWILGGMQHAIWLRENTDIHIDVISMSIGLGMPWSAVNDGTDPWSLMADELVAHGITVVQSAGNVGPGAFTVGQGACAEENIAVGGYVYARMMKFYYDWYYWPGWSENNLFMDDDAEMIWYFASRGPTRDYRYQPAVVAPCAFTMGAGDDASMYWGSGTSFAAPRVAGEALLLVNYYKGIVGTYPTPDRIKAAIVVGADYIDGYEKIDQGAGRWSPAGAKLVIFEEDLIGTAREILNANEFHEQRMQTVHFEGGVAEVRAENVGIEHYARFYLKLEDPDMYRISVTDIEETLPGYNRLYIWITDPKSDLLNIAYAYYDTWYDRIYQYSDMGRYYWLVGSTEDSGAYGYNQYWTPLDAGYYEVCVENDYFSWEPVNFTLRIEKVEVGMSASASSVTLKNKGADIDFVSRGGLYAYEGFIDEWSDGPLKEGEMAVKTFTVPDDASELIVTLDWTHDYFYQHPSDLDLYLIDPLGNMWVVYDPPFTPMGIFGGSVNIPETDYFGDYTAGNIVPGTWIALVHAYHVWPQTQSETFTLRVEVRTREVTRPFIRYDAPQVDFFWEPIEIPTIIVEGDDSYGTYTLPFEFPFYDGNTYDTIYVCTNGYITLDSGLSSYNPGNYFLDSAMIAVMGEDLVSTVYAIDHGSYVTILWYGRPYGMYPERDLMLAQLYDNGDIVFSYADWVSPDYWGRDAVAGLSRGDGSTCITISPGDETAFLFEYSATTTTIEVIENYTVDQPGHALGPYGTELFSGDDTYASYTLPFDFPFFESTCNTIYIGSNGYITLDSGLSSYNPASYFLDRAMIAVMGEDLVTNVYVIEYADLVVIQWYGCPYGMGPDRSLMRVQLHDNGNIKMIYEDWVSPDYWGHDAVAGVSKGDGSTYVTISPYTGTAFRFQPVWGTVEVLEVDYAVSSTDYFFETVTPPIVSGDDAYVEYALPFDFWFYGETYDSVYVGTNGYITFTEGHTDYSGIEGLFLSTPMIAAQAQDLISTIYAIDHGTYVTFLWFGRQFGEPAMRDLMMAQLHSDGTVYISIKEWIGPDYWGAEAVAGISAGDGVSYVRVYPPHDEKAYEFTLAEIVPPAIEFSEPHPWLPAPIPPHSRYVLTISYTENIEGRYIFVAKHDWVEKFFRDGGVYASVFGRFLYETSEAYH
ncbi:hypothetical protein ES702_03045 [subsurface metagenome]